jgi:hypothetical protein
MPLKNNIGSFFVAFDARQTATRKTRPSTVSMLNFGARFFVICVSLPRLSLALRRV